MLILLYSRVVDLAKERDFEIRVSWMQSRAYADVLDISVSGGTSSAFGVAPIAVSDITANGVISVQVLNELTTPNSTAVANAYVLAFVRGAENLHFQCPDTEKIEDVSFFTFQSGEMDCANNPDPAMADHTQDVVGQSDVPDMTPLVYAGERIVSLRQLLRRYWFHSTSTNFDSTTSVSIVRAVRNNFPEYRGYDSSGLNLAAGGGLLIPYTYCKTTLLNYVTPAYIGQRGGIRYKYAAYRDSGTPGSLTVGRSQTNLTSATRDQVIALTGTEINSTLSKLATNDQDIGYGGYATPVSSNPTAEVELPFYSPFRFAFARHVRARGVTEDGTNLMSHTIDNRVDSGTVSYVDRYISIGEDFTLFFYLNAPVVTFYPNPAGI